MATSAVPVLIGQYDSPFVRRVAITMRLYGMPFEHQPWSVFRDAEKIATYNPLRRVPTLVMPSGETLIESTVIVDALDDQVADEQLLLPRRGAQRRAGLKIVALAFGLADKGVALVYENVFRESGTQSMRWTARCERQVADTLQLLENERASIHSPWWFGEKLSHADIAVGIAMRFMAQAAPRLVPSLRLPALRDHQMRCQTLVAPFAEIDQPLSFPE